MHDSKVLVGLLTLFLAAGAAAREIEMRGDDSLLPQDGREVQLRPCGTDEVQAQMLCGTLEVAEDPDEPERRSIALNFIVIPAIGESGTSAVFHLDGGPGISATNGAAFYVDHELGRAFRNGRDAVVLDQRGTGGSHPLRCPQTEDNGPLDEMYRVEEVDQCRRELEKKADLTKYGSWYAAGDLDALREALGYEQVDFWALSYGTKLAQIYMKRYPERVRTAFLVGAVDLESFRTPLMHAASGQRILDLLFHACQNDPGCWRTYPKLREDWSRILARLEKGPISSVRTERDSGEQTTVEIRRGPFGHAFAGLLTTTSSQRRVPHLIHRMASGDFEPFVNALGFGPSPFAEGLYLSIACTEGTSRIDEEDVAPVTFGTFLGDWRIRQQMDACARWPKASLPADFFEPPAADTQVIVISGEMDQPPSVPRSLCRMLSNCRILFVPNLGHTYFDVAEWPIGEECIDSIALSLYERGDVDAVDASCIHQMVPPPFKLD